MGYNCDGVRFDDTINAKIVGVKNDGIHDVSDALNSLFQNYSRVYLPAGTYLISKTLVVPDNTVIFGDNDNTIIQLASSFSLTPYAWRDSYKYPVISVGGNCEVTDLKLNGDTTAYKDLGMIGILVRGDFSVINHVIVDNINYFPDDWIDKHSGDPIGYGYETVNSPGYGISVMNASNVSITNCISENNAYEGIGTENSNYVVIKDCYVGDTNRTGIQVHRNSNNIIIDGCIIKNNNEYKHADITLHGAENLEINNVSINRCVIDGATERTACIHSVWAYEKNVRFTNNIINSKKEIMWLGQNPLSNIQNAIIVQNVFSVDLDNDGIVVNGNKCIITDNVFSVNGISVSVSGNDYIIKNNIGIVDE